ncbi:hypothetical protein [Nocardiopsis valliformis]|uniref:hypothetical protein n=1 Tax=Nocardiopsis valliformis TaxID=239974 RepID=UPI000349D255|nr:hypothetical protein [Nocardiopsis valliformis]
MIRLTHRRCRDEAAGLADVAARQTTLAEGLYIENEKLTGQVESLADDLRATEHAMDEVVDACKSLAYGLGDEVDIPDALRSRLRDAAQLPEVLHRLDEAQEKSSQLAAEYNDQQVALLRAAHEAGTLARTWVLMVRSGMEWQVPTDLAELVRGVLITTWIDESRWDCPTAGCERFGRAIVWHADHRDLAHHACPCGATWAAAHSEVTRTATARKSTWGRIPDNQLLQHRPDHVLEAFDRAIPTPTQIHSRALAV